MNIHGHIIVLVMLVMTTIINAYILEGEGGHPYHKIYVLKIHTYIAIYYVWMNFKCSP